MERVERLVSFSFYMTKKIAIKPRQKLVCKLNEIKMRVYLNQYHSVINDDDILI